MSNNQPRIPSMSGFTAVEAMAALLVAALFIQSIFSIFTLINQNIERTRIYAVADDYAYSELRKYSVGPLPCTASDDLQANANAPGKTVFGYPATDIYGVFPLPKPYSVTITTNAVAGCVGGMSQLTKITATVVYGSPVTTVEHSTYVR